MTIRYPLIAAALAILGFAGYHYTDDQRSPVPSAAVGEPSSSRLGAVETNIEPKPSAQPDAEPTPGSSKTASTQAAPASNYGILVNEDLGVGAAAQRRMALVLPGAIDHRIRQQDPVIDEILLLTRDKVLRSSADKARIAELYQKEPMLRDFAKSLGQKPGTKDLYRDDLQLRLHRLDFVSKALANGDGVDRDAILDQLKAAFIVDTIEADYPLHQKKSLTYEKIQLLKLIDRYEPGYAASVRQTVQQSPNPKVYQYILSQL